MKILLHPRAQKHPWKRPRFHYFKTTHGRYYRAWRVQLILSPRKDS